MRVRSKNILDFSVIIKYAEDILNAFCVVHYTYLKELSLFCGLNNLHFTYIIYSYTQLSQNWLFKVKLKKYYQKMSDFDAQSCFYCLL